MINTFQELHNRFDAIARATHNVTRTSAGAVGELFEELMQGEIVGNDRGADFAGDQYRGQGASWFRCNHGIHFCAIIWH